MPCVLSLFHVCILQGKYEDSMTSLHKNYEFYELFSKGLYCDF